MLSNMDFGVLGRKRLSVIVTLAILIMATFTAVSILSVSTAFASVDVDTVYDMTTDDILDQVILDVRPSLDFTYAHLHDAISIPYDKLESSIKELQELEPSRIIIYCKTGRTSQKACEMLGELGFTGLFNMIGGITEWVRVGYPIDSTSHHVTVGPGGSLQIEPFLLELSRGSSCEEDGNDGEGTVVESTVIEEDADHAIVLHTFEIDGEVYELTVASNLLWSHEEQTGEVNRTVEFFEVDVSGIDSAFVYYSFRYRVHHDSYLFIMETSLEPLDSTTYNRSGTYAKFIPYDEPEYKSLEFVEFKSTIKLSSLYHEISRVARRIGNIYDESTNEEYTRLAMNYLIMENEIQVASNIVSDSLNEYDKEILHNSAVLADDYWSCVACQIPWTAICMVGCTAIAWFFPPALPYYTLCLSLGCLAFSNVICDLIGWCP